MGTASGALTVPASVHEAETCWYDTDRWAAWVDGLERVVSVEGKWPGTGAVVRWQSGPAGRGNVSERVVAYEPLSGQLLDVQDDSLTGRQSVAFTPEGEGTRVTLSLEYRITKRSIFTPLVDLLFVRRAMTASLQSTLHRFASSFVR
jgi:Polyketide cyclase / dehydrase and lipid transport